MDRQVPPVVSQPAAAQLPRSLPVLFERLVHADGAATHGLLQKLTVARDQAVSGGEAHLGRARWAACYLALLRQLAAEDPRAAAQLQALASQQGILQWASPLSSTPCHLLPVGSLEEEEVVAAHLYASLLQEQARNQSYILPSSNTFCGGPADSRCIDSPTPRGGETAGGAGATRGNRWARLKSLLSLRGRSARRQSVSQRPDTPTSPRSAPSSPALSFTCAGSSRSPGSSCSSPAFRNGGPLEAGEGAVAYARAATLYRQAAGVYDHIATLLLPAACARVVGMTEEKVAGADEAGADEAGAGAAEEAATPATPAVERSAHVELRPGLAEALSQMCLAQANGVAAQRAADKGGSPALAAALHRGTSDLFRAAGAAVAAIKPATHHAQHTISDILPCFLAVCALRHQAAAWQQAALHQQAQLQAGAAVACTAEGILLAKQALETWPPADESGSLALAGEVVGMERLQAALDRERLVVHFQKVPPVAPELPPSRVLVAPLPFDEGAAGRLTCDAFGEPRADVDPEGTLLA